MNINKVFNCGYCCGHISKLRVRLIYQHINQQYFHNLSRIIKFSNASMRGVIIMPNLFLTIAFQTLHHSLRNCFRYFDNKLINNTWRLYASAYLPLYVYIQTEWEIIICINENSDKGIEQTCWKLVFIYYRIARESLWTFYYLTCITSHHKQ